MSSKLTIEQLQHTQGVAFPELEAARDKIQLLETAPRTQRLLQQTQHFMEEIALIPQTSYTHYRVFRNTGERGQYQTPYFLKRKKLAAAVLRLFLGQTALKDVVQDYLWNICEESNWVVPAHEFLPIDLFAAETAFLLAETLHLLGEILDGEVRHRIRAEIDRRIFDPYLRFHRSHSWYQRASNWNGVCNSSVAATFVLLEPEPERVIHALEVALSGLQAFVDTAFTDDGSSTEGVSYWHYGLINFIALSELLYARSGGAINLLAGEKMKRIAAFPAKLQLSGSCFASFADCDESLRFHPGIITRLAERTGEQSLLNLLAPVAELESDWRLSMMLRDILWWDGSQPDAPLLTDARQPIGGTARLVTHTEQGVPVVLSIKAGHNNEQHNHNDVGSFLLHIAGENLLTDPGRGLYSRDYFGAKRYDNIFANSYGHSVPRIDGMLQGTGQDFAGTLLESEGTAELDGYKRVAIEFARAYPCADLKSARRELLLATKGDAAGTAWLRDHFQFAGEAHEVEEAFVTWMECEIDGATARIHGQQHDVYLTIEQPQGVQFRLERLEEQSKANERDGILKRLSIVLPREMTIDVSIRMTTRKQ
ncbi:MAG: heparinase II/III family protein [Chloroflexi bacterium]|nr:heparinase II/III family protein [Chloroflexota bacterium]